MSLTITINGERVYHTSFQCSSTRRGGFESCSFQLPKYAPPRLGAEICVFDGTSYVWHGYVEEAGQYQEGTGHGSNVIGVGYGARLKQNPFSMVFIDRDLSRWGPAPTERLLTLQPSGFRSIGSFEVSPSQTDGPGLRLHWEGAWVAGVIPFVEAWYDAGANNSIDTVIGAWRMGGSNNAGDITFVTGVTLTPELDSLPNTNSGDLITSAASSGTYSFWSGGTSGYRYAFINWYYPNSPAGSDGTLWEITHSSVRVIGNHGLTYITVSGGLDGYYAKDILEYAVQRSGANFLIRNDGGLGHGYVVPHCVYYEPVAPEQIVEDIITLLGWNYGTWEPESFLSNTPTFRYGASPDKVTCAVRYADCLGVDIADKLSEMYNHAIALSQDAAGVTSVTTVDASHPRIAKGFDNTLMLNLGLTQTAETQAAFLLSLSQEQSRAAGQITKLPSTTLSGKPTHLLRPGRDRIAILGFPNVGSLLNDLGVSRGDTFQISRLSVSEDANGVVSTSIEVDSGADLTETLTARIAADKVIAGV